ncbi:MAG: 3-oxoacyl-[acyl-carrier protein] reductase [Cellvibrionaceae bacterium]|jgi:3-oxoacyl-[acyl-carrier protein] reductase
MSEHNKPLALITGATRGIGHAIAIAAAEAGYNIAFCYRSHEQQANELKTQLEDQGVEVIACQCDITDEPQVEAFLNQIEQRFDRLDLLVNNAGQTKDGLLATMSVSDMQVVLNTNVIGTMLFCKHALKLMLPARSGSIINLSSVSANKPNKGQCNYAASKGAIESLTRALAVEVASRGIRVNAVAPGVIKTDMAGELLDQYESQLKKRLLAKNLGEVDDIARTVMFLADPANHYITGEVIHVDGGLTLG